MSQPMRDQPQTVSEIGISTYQLNNILETKRPSCEVDLKKSQE